MYVIRLFVEIEPAKAALKHNNSVRSDKGDKRSNVIVAQSHWKIFILSNLSAVNLLTPTIAIWVCETGLRRHL